MRRAGSRLAPVLGRVAAARSPFLLCVALALAACRPPPQIGTLSLAETTGENGKRYGLELQQVVLDPLAYNRTRGVYVLRDKQTGREWIGVSGIGLSELGSHLEYSPALKQNVSEPDER